jgi:hypothetical protein
VFFVGSESRADKGIHFCGERNQRCLQFTNVMYIAFVGDIYSPVDGTRCIAVFHWEDVWSSKRSDI